MALPPGPPLPESLQTIEWMARPTAFLRRCGDRYGEAFTIRVSTTGAPMVLLWDPGEIRRLFTEHADVARGGSSTAALEPFVGPRSILLLDGPEHLRQRRLILPPLHGEAMRAQAPLVARLAEEELASWPRDRPVATLPRMRALTLEVVLRLVFGARDRAEVEPLRAAIERPLQITSSLPRLLGLARGMRRPWRMFHEAVRALDAEVARAIAPASRRSPGGLRPGRAARRPPRGRVAAVGRGAARPARHAARRGPRDDGERAGLGVRAPEPPP